MPKRGVFIGGLILVLMLSLTCSCGNKSSQVLDPVDTPQLRAASSISIELAGNEFIKQHGKNNRPGEKSPNGHIIAPGGDDDIAWAWYKVGSLSKYRPTDVSIDVCRVIAPGGDDDLPLIFWIGVFDYTKLRWHWEGPYTDNTSIVVNSSSYRDRVVSLLDELNFMVMTDCSGVQPSPSNPEGITAVEISVTATEASTKYYSTAPYYTMFTQAYLGVPKAAAALDPDTQYVTLTWEHAEDSDNFKNEALKYEIWRDLLDDQIPVPLLHGKLDAPAEQFIDPLDKIPGMPEPIPGATYRYYLTAINIGGKTPLDKTDPITIPFYAPQNLSASDGEYPGMVVLTWDAAEGAEGYEIYRDSQDEPFATVEDATTWQDVNPGDQSVHTYWVKGVNEYAATDFSQPDTGYCGLG